MADYEITHYEIIQFKAGDFKDGFGNYWCDMALKGISEPVRIAVKDPLNFKTGDTLYGVPEHKTSKANKPYLKFKRMQEDEQPVTTYYDQEPKSKPFVKKEWQPRDDDVIRAQWAIGQAMTHFATKDKVKLPDVETLAGALFEMVERVKSPKADAPTLTLNVEEQQAQREADRDAERLRGIGTEDTVYISDEPINLNDIPF